MAQRSRRFTPAQTDSYDGTQPSAAQRYAAETCTVCCLADAKPSPHALYAGATQTMFKPSVYQNALQAVPFPQPLTGYKDPEDESHRSDKSAFIRSAVVLCLTLLKHGFALFFETFAAYMAQTPAVDCHLTRPHLVMQ